MVAKLKSVDIADVTSLRALVDEVRSDGTPRMLRSGNEDVAVLMPVSSVRSPWRRRERTTADYEAFRASAGGWQNVVDVEQFKRDNAASRSTSTRPHVEL